VVARVNGRSLQRSCPPQLRRCGRGGGEGEDEGERWWMMGQWLTEKGRGRGKTAEGGEWRARTCAEKACSEQQCPSGPWPLASINRQLRLSVYIWGVVCALLRACGVRRSCCGPAESGKNHRLLASLEVAHCTLHTAHCTLGERRQDRARAGQAISSLITHHDIMYPVANGSHVQASDAASPRLASPRHGIPCRRRRRPSSRILMHAVETSSCGNHPPGARTSGNDPQPFVDSLRTDNSQCDRLAATAAPCDWHPVALLLPWFFPASSSAGSQTKSVSPRPL
jgi:hypothetical protein